MPFLHHCVNTDHYNTKKSIYKPNRNGFQRVLSKDIHLYEGNWVNGKTEKFGVLSKRVDKKSFRPLYKGNWHDGRRSGPGRGYFPDGGYYVGNWNYGKRNGYGRMWFSDGTFYDGDWKCGRREGKGLLVEVNGNRYEGDWKDNMKHGYGRIYHLSTGQLQEGSWWKDQIVASTMEDMQFRQTAVFPTQYIIPEETLLEGDEILQETNEQIFENDGQLFPIFVEDEIPEKALSSHISITKLRYKYRYV